jgi:hypothetical protein
MKYKLIILTSVYFFCFAGCKKDDEIGNIPDLTIQMYQVSSPSGSILTTYFAGGSYECMNVLLNKTLSISGNTINIDFTSTSYTDGTCHETTYPDKAQAIAEINFGYLSNGTYTLNISMNRRTYKGSLTVTDSKFRMELNANQKIKFYLNKQEISRVPTNAFYGGVRSLGTTPISNYLDTFSALGVTTRTYPTGDYGNFYIQPSGQMYANQFYGYDSSFVLSFSGDINQIINVSQYYKDSLSVYSEWYDGKGNHFH